MKILIVDHDSEQREVLRHLLEARFQQQAKLREADCLKTAFGYLARGDVDCIVLDLHLPDSDGRATFHALREQYPEVPIVVMTNNEDRSLALDMIKAGASDYLIKNYTNDEEAFRRILFAVEQQRRGLKVPYDQLSEASREQQAKRNADAVTKRPHAIATIHVPEIGPRSGLSKVHYSSLPPAPRKDDPVAPPVEVDVPAGQALVQRQLDELSARMSKLGVVVALVLVLLIAVLWYSVEAVRPR